jgi:hypothetical protein
VQFVVASWRTLLIARSTGSLYIIDLGFFGTDALADLLRKTN